MELTVQENLEQKKMPVIKLCRLLLTAACLQIAATSFGQNITLHEKKTPLQKVFKQIEKQSGYVFFFNYLWVSEAKPVTLDLTNATLKQALDECFKDQPFDYAVVNKTVVVRRKDEAQKKPVTVITDAITKTSGKILDETGKPVGGVFVKLKSTNRGVVSNDNGEFTFSGLDASSILVFSSVNMEPMEIKVNGREYLAVNLKTKEYQLDDVAVTVNTGYQVLNKEKSTGSVVTIGPKQLEQRYNPNLLDEIEGRAPGLVTYATGLNGTSLSSTNRSVTIRGVSTLQNGVGALIVADGLPIEGSISDINPYDVENISILKDAAAASLYGARASNGVIVITTKKAKGSRTVIESSSDFSYFQKPNYGYLQYMTPAQQVDFESSVNNYFFTNTATAATTVNSYINAYNYPISPITYLYYQNKLGNLSTDQLNSNLAALKKNNFVQQYRDNAMLNQLLQQYNLAVRSGGTKYQSSLVVNFKQSNKGIIYAKTTNFNLFYKGSYNVSKWLDVDFGVNTVYNYDKSQFNSNATTPFNVPAYQQLIDDNGNRVQYRFAESAYNNFTSVTSGFSPLNFNHLDELGQDFTVTQALNSRMYVHVNANIANGLRFASQYQYEDLRSDANTLSPQDSYTMRYLRDATTISAVPLTGPYTALLPATGGRLAVSTNRGNNYTWRNQFDFNRTFARKHSITAIAGFEFRQTFIRSQNSLYLGYDDNLLTNQNSAINWPALATPAYSYSGVGYFLTPSGAYSAYLNPTNYSGISETMHRYSSGYTTLTYSYDRRYNVYGSLRKDVADLFGADADLRGRPFYSVGFGWDAHNEAFLKSITAINFLKLRITYGLTGNTDFTTTKYPTATATRNTVTNLSWLIVGSPSNPKLTWELTHTTNLGLDFGFFKNRLNGSVDVYNKLSTDLIARKSLDASEGYTAVAINNGQVLNKGVEVLLDYAWLKPAKRNGLGINTAFTFGFNQNKITQVDNYYGSSAAAQVTPSNGRPYMNGYPVNSLFSYQYNGINASGLPEWTLADKTTTTGTVSNAKDLVFSGTVDPKITMGLTPEVNYKGFSLSALFMYYGGAKMRADQVSSTVSGIYVSGYAPIKNYYLNGWTPTNTNTLIPGNLQYYPSNATVSNYGLQLSLADRFVQPADFIKMRTAALSYTLSSSLAKKIAANSIRLRFQVQNGWTVWTKNKTGVDPEANDAYQGTYGAGRLLPAQASFIFGANINF